MIIFRRPAVLLLVIGVLWLALSGCRAPRQILNASRPLGPYSGAVLVGNTAYLSGQLGIDPASGELVPGGVGPETEQTLRNLGTMLQKAGFEFSDVVRATVFLTDINDYKEMNEAYAKFLGESPPARACVEVSDLVKGAKVEISCIAAR